MKEEQKMPLCLRVVATDFLSETSPSSRDWREVDVIHSFVSCIRDGFPEVDAGDFEQARDSLNATFLLLKKRDIAAIRNIIESIPAARKQEYAARSRLFTFCLERFVESSPTPACLYVSGYDLRKSGNEKLSNEAVQSLRFCIERGFPDFLDGAEQVLAGFSDSPKNNRQPTGYESLLACLEYMKEESQFDRHIADLTETLRGRRDRSPLAQICARELINLPAFDSWPLCLRVSEDDCPDPKNAERIKASLRACTNPGFYGAIYGNIDSTKDAFMRALEVLSDADPQFSKNLFEDEGLYKFVAGAYSKATAGEICAKLVKLASFSPKRLPACLQTDQELKEYGGTTSSDFSEDGHRITSLEDCLINGFPRDLQDSLPARIGVLTEAIQKAVEQKKLSASDVLKSQRLHEFLVNTEEKASSRELYDALHEMLADEIKTAAHYVGKSILSGLLRSSFGRTEIGEPQAHLIAGVVELAFPEEGSRQFFVREDKFDIGTKGVISGTGQERTLLDVFKSVATRDAKLKEAHPWLAPLLVAEEFELELH